MGPKAIHTGGLLLSHFLPRNRAARTSAASLCLTFGSPRSMRSAGESARIHRKHEVQPSAMTPLTVLRLLSAFARPAQYKSPLELGSIRRMDGGRRWQASKARRRFGTASTKLSSFSKSRTGIARSRGGCSGLKPGPACDETREPEAVSPTPPCSSAVEVVRREGSCADPI